MKEWSFYSIEDGRFLDRVFFSSNSDAVKLNTPAGCVAIEGRYDPLSQRMDLSTGKIVVFRPEKPDDFHEWDDNSKRWVLERGRHDRMLADLRARDEIAKLESQQHRRVRELLAENDPKLKKIDEQIAELRNGLLKD